MENPSPWDEPPLNAPKPQAAPNQNASASSNAMISLVLGIGSWLFGFSLMMSIPGFIVARQELAAIESGVSSEAGKGFAQAGYWLSLTNIIFSALGLLAFIIFAVVMGVGMIGLSTFAGSI